jgi:Cu/Ag efflux pump CusA
VTAILASLAVALTVTPALSYLLLPQVAARRTRDAPLLRWLKSGYRPILGSLLKRPRTALAVLAVAFGTGAVIYPTLGQEMLPNFREYDFLMHWLERPGTSLEAMNRITIRASQELRSVDGVRNFGAHVGRAEVADEVVGIDFTELWISLDPRVNYEETVVKLQEVVNGYPGLYRDLLTYLRERIKEVLTGASGAIVVRIYGPDLEALTTKANEVAARLASVEGVGDLHVQQQTLVPQIEIKFKPEVAASFGLSPQHVRRITEVLLTGVKVGEIYEDQKVFDVVVRGEPRFSRDIDAVRDLIIDTPTGASVPVRDVADVYIAPAPNMVARESASRRIDVTMNPAGRALDAVAADVEAALAEIPFERGYYPELLGEFAELEEARNRLMIIGLVCIGAIFLILQTLFQSLRIGILMFLGLPAALVGGIIAAWLDTGLLSLGSFIGFITVLGISARNGIMLVSHYRHLETQEGFPFGPELVLKGAEERLAPILMTSLAAGLALLPLIVGGLKPGHEVEHPMAVVIVGGLVTSTLLNLFLLPALYLRYSRKKSERLIEAYA